MPSLIYLCVNSSGLTSIVVPSAISILEISDWHVVLGSPRFFDSWYGVVYPVRKTYLNLDIGRRRFGNGDKAIDLPILKIAVVRFIPIPYTPTDPGVSAGLSGDRPILNAYSCKLQGMPPQDRPFHPNSDTPTDPGVSAEISRILNAYS